MTKNATTLSTTQITYWITGDDSGTQFDGELYAGLLHAVHHLTSDERRKLIKALKDAHAEIEGTNR